MISAEDFKARWNTKVFPLIKYDSDKLNKVDIPIESKFFLSNAGLPDSAAPFLNFQSIVNGGLSTLNEEFNIEGAYAQYIYIGFTGSDDIIAIKNKSGEVVIIDHENFKEYYLNGSIIQLAESLLEYADFIKMIKNIYGNSAYLDRIYSKKELELIKNKLTQIDAISLKKNNFWSEELDLFE